MGTCLLAGSIPDEDLVRRCRLGEDDAFSQLYYRYRDPVLSTAYRIVRNTEEAQDVTQEIFLKVYRSLADWNPERARLSTWLYRLATNHAVDSWRGRQRRLRLLATGESGNEGLFLRYGSDKVPTPYKLLERKEKARQVWHCLRGLPRLQRRFFILRYFRGLSLDEIAGLEGRSLGTVKAGLFRATRAVRRRLLRARGIDDRGPRP